jgi:hypothetical protein
MSPALLPGAPRIQSAGLPPEIHANRVVGEMLRWVAATRQDRHTRIKEFLDRAPDGNPRAQGKILARIKQIVGPFIISARLTPGKRGRYEIRLVTIDAWDPARCNVILSDKAEIPRLPWLACCVVWIEGKGRYRCEETFAHPFVTHHALSRLAQRCGARSAGDLIIAVRNIWAAYRQEHRTRGDVSGQLRFRLQPDEYALATLSTYRDYAAGAGAFACPVNFNTAHIPPLVVTTILDE